MNRDKFLYQVADYLLKPQHDLSRWTLVFPNKRSALFLKKYMHETMARTSTKPRFMPRYTTMGNFVAGMSSRPEMPKLQQLFVLYDCYRKLLDDMGREAQVQDFDRFVFWGRMILDDFDDVDRQLVDAAKLYKNLKDLKEINADFLDDEQKQIVRRIWGETARTAAVKEFWTHVRHDDDNEDSPEANFVTLWQLLGDLYASFKAALHAEGQDTAGGQYREAAGKISDRARELAEANHYAFIGFNDLTHSETLILKRLKDAGAADFFWDFDNAMVRLIPDPRMKRNFRTLLREFPMPADFSFEASTNIPDIEVIAIPSSVAQVKYVGDILKDWVSEGLIDEPRSIETAIVVPDEKLLTPLLMSIPDEVTSINVTMGLPFVNTSFASMLQSIISMQMRAREIKGRMHYYFADVVELLSHPHIQVIAANTAERIKKRINDKNLYNIDVTELCDEFPDVAYLFDSIKRLDSPGDFCDYMDRLIDGLLDAIKQNGGASADGLPEIQILTDFRNSISEIRQLIERYHIEMKDNTFFSIFERIMNARRIEMQGTPLHGLQVMGVLETRSLDFDNIVVMSMNENTLPRKSYMKTLIPNNLRVGYGLTTIDRQDSLYTFYFYRMLARAHNVKLIYDSRPGSFGAGEPSRYIAQLRHLLPADKLKFSAVGLNPSFNAPEPIVVNKTEKVLDELKKFLPGGKSYISASAIKDYKKCRLLFYLRYVKNQSGEDKITEYIPPTVYGSIVHKVVENLYGEYEGKRIDSATIKSILNDVDNIDRVIAETVQSMFYTGSKYSSADEMPAEGSITCFVIGIYVRKMLEIESREAETLPFVFVKAEMSVKSPPAWKIDDNLSINFKMKIDRVDRLEDGRLRFIDYKTGADKVDNTNMNKIFAREEKDADAVFQLLTYCCAYNDIMEAHEAIKPMVYPFRQMAHLDQIPEICIDKEIIQDYATVKAEFRENFNKMIREIFDSVTPFDQAEKQDSCGYCQFAELCGRAGAKKH